jgi:hypothetical protein
VLHVLDFPGLRLLMMTHSCVILLLSHTGILPDCLPVQVRDALLAKAQFLGRTSEREASATAFAAAEEKTASSGAKADMIFDQTR